MFNMQQYKNTTFEKSNICVQLIEKENCPGSASVVYLFQKQHEVSDAFGTAARRLVERQLEEREGEAPRETEVGDGTQGRETGGARQTPLG